MNLASCLRVVIDLLQAGIRTAYRTLGAREVAHATGEATLRGFAFDGDHEAQVVLLHGLGDASTTWFQTVGPLRKRYDLLALDLPPFGISELHERPYLDPGDQAQLVVGALEAEASGPVHLVGQSLGAWVAAHVAHRRPDLLASLVLISPGGAPLAGSLPGMELLMAETAEDVLALWKAMWYRPPAVAKALPGSTLHRFRRPAFREFVASLHLDAVPAQDPEDLDLAGIPDELLDHLATKGLLVPGLLAAIDVPALVLWGVHDGLLDRRTPAYLARHWGAGVDRTYLARCGHLAHLERPRFVAARVLAHVGQGPWPHAPT